RIYIDIVISQTVHFCEFDLGSHILGILCHKSNAISLIFKILDPQMPRREALKQMTLPKYGTTAAG
ncbi:MAG: hypothetical protein IIW34_08060, partial [Clostridia bacterium]|nr:hypothetical protein [Clostridia bacterium]